MINTPPLGRSSGTPSNTKTRRFNMCRSVEEQMAVSRRQLRDRQRREQQREFAREIAAFDAHSPVRLLSSQTTDFIEPFVVDLRSTALTNDPMNAAHSSKDSIAITQTPLKQRRTECDKRASGLTQSLSALDRCRHSTPSISSSIASNLDYTVRDRKMSPGYTPSSESKTVDDSLTNIFLQSSSPRIKNRSALRRTIASFDQLSSFKESPLSPSRPSEKINLCSYGRHMRRRLRKEEMSRLYAEALNQQQTNSAGGGDKTVDS